MITLENLLRLQLLRLAGKGLTHRSLSINSGFGEFLQQTTELALEDLRMEWSRAFLLIFEIKIHALKRIIPSQPFPVIFNSHQDGEGEGSQGIPDCGTEAAIQWRCRSVQLDRGTASPRRS